MPNGRNESDYSVPQKDTIGKMKVSLPRGVTIEAWECSKGSNILIAVPKNSHLQNGNALAAQLGSESRGVAMTRFDRDGMQHIAIEVRNS